MTLLRKLLVGIVSLTIVVGMYVLYSRISSIPPITIREYGDVQDTNVTTVDGQGGAVGPVKIPVAQGVVYQTRGPDKEIDREFGFGELVRTIGDVWEVNEPWMRVYQPRFQLYIRADKGTTELETVVERPAPKDATFVGNVTIEILPAEGSEYKKNTVYLDSLIFLSDKSQFSTPGPVKLVSPDVQLDGKGLVFVYNDLTGRLEYLRLIELEALRIKTTEAGLLSQVAAQSDSKEAEPTGPAGETPKSKPVPEAVKPPVAETAKPEPEPAEGKYYKCVLSKNVLVDAPEQLVFARRQICLNDILWSKSSVQESPSDANSPDEGEPAEPNQIANARTTAGVVVAAAAGGPKPNPPTEPNQPTVEIVVTCDNGILLIPMNSKRKLTDFPQSGTPASTAADTRPEAFDAAAMRATFLAETIDYNAVSGDVLADGASELVFYTGSVAELDANDVNVPVTVTSQEGVEFFKSLNHAVFKGDCLLTMPQEELTQERDARLSASKFTVNLPTRTPEGTKVSGDVVAAGPVELIFYVEDSNAAEANEPPLPVVVSAEKEARFLPDANQVIFDVNCLCTMPQKGTTHGQDFTLASPQIIASFPGGGVKGASRKADVLATGPVNLGFYVADGNDPNAEPLPATVTAEKYAHFVPSENQIRFEGDCKANMVRLDPNYVETFVLMSPQITVDLPPDSNDRSGVSPLSIEYLKAHGGLVRLGTKKSIGEKQLGGVELECRKFDYDPGLEVFTATGPGEMWLDNSNVAEPNELADPNAKSDKFSLKKPCWAYISNFDTLKYFQAANKITAEATSEGSLIVKYLTIKNGRPLKLHEVTTNHVDVDLIKTALGETELSTLTASGGIMYHSGDNEFIGGELFYDHAAELMTVVGSETFPCHYNGYLTDHIEYNLKTGTIKADVVGPGAGQFK